ncbi:MAG TPA: hypothetical protein VNP20_21360 [Nocardioidaceae bacterium]|nr:hypothetical protein [Nocardioidaceae bacterium]
MSEQPATTGPKPPVDPRQRCAKCGSTDHPTGYHEGSVAPTGQQPGGVSPKGYHEGSIAGESLGEKINEAEGQHDNTAPRGN